MTSRTGTASSSPAGNVITGDELDVQSYPNVWELLRSRFAHYSYVEDKYGRAIAIRSHRGGTSFFLTSSDSPLVVIDGARLIDFGALQMMPTDDVDHIELLDGMHGTALQGTNAGAGVIYIYTRLAPDPGH
ncbi:MAG: TonB-dependent receptor [Gemmatimonadaceae bacterium]